METPYNSIKLTSAMYIVVDEDDRRPIYRQVADEIKALIARGELCEGAALPPVRQVAANLGVNLNTIAAAYRELQREGLISVRHGSGAVVASRTFQEKREKSDGELRKPLRAALTQLVLAGLPRAEIMALVGEELRGLLRGSR
jgi:GntR family transcriptional regulator